MAGETKAVIRLCEKSSAYREKSPSYRYLHWFLLRFPKPSLGTDLREIPLVPVGPIPKPSLNWHSPTSFGDKASSPGTVFADQHSVESQRGGWPWELRQRTRAAVCARCCPRKEATFTNVQESSIMPDINTLASRIDAEFSAVEEKMKKFQVEQVEQHKQRQIRLEQLGKVFDQLRDIWKPRLELLVKKFEDRVKVKPRIVPSTREVTFDFQSHMARVSLKFSAFTDLDIQKVILSYNLEIIPVLMRFNPHGEVEFPLNEVNKEAVAKWFDDRIVDFVRTYFAMGENDIYLKDYMVEDPVAHVRFPKYAAATTLEWQGQKFYFIGAETRREFAEKNGIAIE
jgi:hypothetical protein